ncbi:MAG: hypothetical protein ACFE9Z_05855 [Promethearchaeota archaeon]
MIKKQRKIKTLVLFILLSFFLGISSFMLNNNKSFDFNTNYLQNEKLDLPKTAQTPQPLPYWAINRSNSTIYRMFESVNFTIDTFDYGGEANKSKMQIVFTNSSIRYYDMIFIGNNKFSYEYMPSYNAPLGLQNVSFLIYNETNYLLNTQTTYTNFTILTNYMLNFNSSEYYIEDILNAELIISNFKTHNFTWDLAIVNSTNSLIQDRTVSLNSDLVQFTVPLKNDTFEKNEFYYVQLNITDKNDSNTNGTAYFSFYVKNNNPIITSIINVSLNEIFRTEDFILSLNATDVETNPEDLIASLHIYDSTGELVIEDNAITFRGQNLFSETYNIPSYEPIGIYSVNVTIQDQHGGEISKIRTITVKNNLPEIHSYTINDMPMNQKISVFYGRDLIFRFNVSDVEGIAYVKVALLNENNEWFNITREYYGENTQITIRTIDLLSGTWYVYIDVIDSDGAVIRLISDYDKAPQAITIIPDFLSTFLPWIVFFVGLGIGIFVGIGSAYSYFKSKIVESPKRKKTKQQKLIERKKTTLIKEELKEKDIEELTPSKEDEEEGVPKRKIKRKL